MTDSRKRLVQAAISALFMSLGFALGLVYGHGAATAPIIIEKCSR